MVFRNQLVHGFQTGLINHDFLLSIKHRTTAVIKLLRFVVSEVVTEINLRALVAELMVIVDFGTLCV